MLFRPLLSCDDCGRFWLDGLRVCKLEPQMARHVILPVKRIISSRLLDGPLGVSSMGDVVDLNIQRELHRIFVFQ